MTRKLVKYLLGQLGLEISRIERDGQVRPFNPAIEIEKLRSRADRLDDALAREFVLFCLEHCNEFRSQLGQDLVVDFFIGTPGFAVEFGATDGVSLSNTYYLENHRNWKCLLAEPGKQWHASLERNRPNAIVDHRCVFSTTGTTVEFTDCDIGELSTVKGFGKRDWAGKFRKSHANTYMVETILLNDLLTDHQVAAIDYLSIDTEGSEFEILSAFDLSRWRPKIITVEHNYTETGPSVFQLMSDHGYTRILQEYSLWDHWYILPEILNRKLSTIKAA